MTPVSRTYPTGTDDELESALSAASLAVQQGSLVVLPTDTVYGIGADAFDPAAVRDLLEAKGRGREMPPPVLVSAATTLDAIATGWSGMRTATVPRVSPRSHWSEACWVHTRVSGPGQKASTRARA